MSLQFITVKHISKVYESHKKTRHALKDVSFEIYPGEVLGLLGVNGAGKTTLSSILASLTPPTSGDVLYKGVSIYKQLNSYRKQVGFCPQKPNLNPLLTLNENLLFAGRFFGMKDPQILQRKKELIDALGLSAYKDAKSSTLSGGYKQRFLIARSLIHSPQFVILDEPTVGLDPHIRYELWEIIKNLRAQGVTVILTTHYLEEAEVLADRVCMIDQGQIKAVGSLEEVKKNYGADKLEGVLLAIQKESR